MNQPLFIYTIYKDTSDVPGPYAIRKWTVHESTPTPSNLFASGIDTLDEARKLIPDHLYNLGRTEHDDPVIVESWI